MMRKFQATLSDEPELDLGQTQKYDGQRQTLVNQLKMNLTGVFNPFESKINEHAEEEDLEEEEVEDEQQIRSQDSFDRE